MGRINTAIGVGISCSAVTLFLQEVNPTNVRGFISGFQEFATCISCVAGMVMGLPVCLAGTNGLLYLVASGLVGTGLRPVLLIYPDTPKFLLLRNASLNVPANLLNTTMVRCECSVSSDGTRERRKIGSGWKFQ